MSINSHSLRALTNIIGPSSAESKVADFIKKQLKEKVDDLYIDKFGNLVAHKKGNGPKLMIAAHMDSIGLMVKRIDDNGFLQMSQIGGISLGASLFQRVIFTNGVEGVITKKETSKLSGELKLKDYFVDNGAKDKAEAEELVCVGDMAVYEPKFYENDNTVTSPSLDDRIGCFIMIETLNQLDKVANDCYFTFTVQEEVGIRGAKTAAFAIDPDYGVAIDVSPAGDTPGGEDYNLKLHDGVAIKARDGSLMPNLALNQHITELAKKSEIKYQIELLDCCGTDAGQISLSREGVPATCLSIPSRYTHSTNETVSKFDVKEAIRLLTEICTHQLP